MEAPPPILRKPFEKGLTPNFIAENSVFRTISLIIISVTRMRDKKGQGMKSLAGDWGRAPRSYHKEKNNLRGVPHGKIFDGS